TENHGSARTVRGSPALAGIQPAPLPPIHSGHTHASRVVAGGAVPASANRCTVAPSGGRAQPGVRRGPAVYQQPKEVITVVNDAVPTTKGTRVAALVHDTGTVLVPGIVLGLTPGARRHRLHVLVRISSGVFRTEQYLVPATASTGSIRHDYV